MRLHAALFVSALALGCKADASREVRYQLGRPATTAEVTAIDVDVAPDGEGMPPGSGTVLEGARIYGAQCASCHGVHGEGNGALYPALIGRDPRDEKFEFGSTPGLTRTIGNYWPYATTVFDYVRRAMPLASPGSLTNDQVYAVTAYLLAENGILANTVRLDSATLRQVRMPAASKFVRDVRKGGPEVR